jgi:type VI secretion system protein ImpA
VVNLAAREGIETMSLHALAMPTASDDTAVLPDDGGYFHRYHGIPLARLLAPLEGTFPTGLPMRGTMSYRMVEQARHSDDATLPMGSWAVELKRANWPKTSALIVNALDGVGKDLQFASWLFEAELNQRGFAAIAPCFILLRGLCETWWNELHPQGDNGDFDARCNIVRWLNEKLLTTLSLLPLVDDGDRAASWSHWELAHYYERLRAVHGDLPEEARDAATLDDLHGLLAASNAEALRERYAELQQGREAIAAFERFLRRQLGHDAPSLNKLDDMLAKVQAPLRGEMARRGEGMERVSAAAPAHAAGIDESVNDDVEEVDDTAEANSLAQLLGDREHAYRVLAEISDYLMQVEPHSPVPYLIRRAVAWGQLNAVELYQEVFQKSGGRIDVFDLLAHDADPS